MPSRSALTPAVTMRSPAFRPEATVTSPPRMAPNATFDRVTCPPAPTTQTKVPPVASLTTAVSGIDSAASAAHW